MSNKRARPSRGDYVRSQGGAAIGARLRRLSERIDRDAGRTYSDAGVSFEQRWFGVLDALARLGPLAVGEVAELLGISHASVSQTCQSLVRANLLEPHGDPEDARRRTLHLTSSARTLIERLTPIWNVLSKVAVELDAEAEHVVAALERLEQALDRQSLYERAKAALLAEESEARESGLDDEDRQPER
jgi:MarR family transcriptional regulator, organic hydroperoxide resistance regulator